jgi:hypothetical protein
VDAETLAGEFVLDAYAIVVDVGPDGADGLVEVLVHAAEGPVSALAGLDWADRAITYEVRWAPEDEGEASREHPREELRAARRRAAAVVGEVARAVVEVTDGVPVDDEGFLLDRYSL